MSLLIRSVIIAINNGIDVTSYSCLIRCDDDVDVVMMLDVEVGAG